MHAFAREDLARIAHGNRLVRLATRFTLYRLKPSAGKARRIHSTAGVEPPASDYQELARSGIVLCTSISGNCLFAVRTGLAIAHGVQITADEVAYDAESKPDVKCRRPTLRRKR